MIYRRIALAVVVVWLLISANYLRLMFFQQDPAYLINPDAVASRLYWSPYPIPEKPRFGFPIHAGWKTLGVLHKWEYLSGTYTSNERSNHLRWYLDGFTRVGLEDRPNYVFVTRELHQLSPSYDSDFVEAHYQHTGDVLVRGEPHIEIWTRDPQAVGYVAYDAELFARAFDQIVPTLDNFPTPVPMHKLPDATIGGIVAIDVAGVTPTRLRPGKLLHLALTWYAEQLLETDYKLFVHVADESGRPHAQWDGMPGQNTLRTSQLVAGQPFTDHVLIRLPDEIDAGRYNILVGFYAADSGIRLGDPASAHVGNQVVQVGTIMVR